MTSSKLVKTPRLSPLSLRIGAELIERTHGIEAPGLIDVIAADFFISNVVASCRQQIDFHTVEQDRIVGGERNRGGFTGENGIYVKSRPAKCSQFSY